MSTRLNAYMDEIEKKELALENVEKDIQENLSVIKEQIEIIKSKFSGAGVEYDDEYVNDSIY